MTGWIWLFGILAVMLAALYCRVNQFGNPQGKLLFKGLASIAFVVLGWLGAAAGGGGAYAVLMVIGLVLGAVGDVLLQMMECRPQNRESFFRSGLGSFLAGHVFYIIAFLFIQSVTVWQFLGALVLFGVMFALQVPARVELGAQKLPVYLYGAVISLMAAFAVGAVCTAPSLRSTLVLLGGILFVVSDAILALIFFSPLKKRSLPTWNLATYYVGQILLALSILAR